MPNRTTTVHAPKFKLKMGPIPFLFAKQTHLNFIKYLRRRYGGGMEIKMKKLHIPALSQGSLNILKFGLAPVALTFVYIAFTCSSLDTYDAVRLFPSLLAQFEHATMSFLLVIGGALLFDIAVREKK